MFTTILFYVFSAILVFAAARVVTARNPVHAALFLVLAFFTAAANWMLLQAEFLAIVLVLVYVGAVMVLFLFVVMMADVNMDELRQGFWGHFPLAAVVGVVIVLEMALVLTSSFNITDAQVPPEAAMIGDTRELGKLIYTEYLYAFEIAAFLLLLAMVAAVALTMRRRKDTRYFNPSDALKVKRNDRVRMVSMQAESERAAGKIATAAPEKQ